MNQTALDYAVAGNQDETIELLLAVGGVCNRVRFKQREQSLPRLTKEQARNQIILDQRMPRQSVDKTQRALGAPARVAAAVASSARRVLLPKKAEK